ncbi:MAG: PatB family C-S lyase [Opitutae bacterium]
MSIQSWFDNCPDRRNKPGLKWGKYAGKDIIPLWVADMDFRAAPSVIEAAREEADFGNYGYAKAHPELIDSVLHHCQTLYDWEVDPNWLIWLPGMVCALNVCCRMQQGRAGQALTNIPVYPPFLSAPGNFDLPCTQLPLKLEHDRFSMDFDLLGNTPTQPGDLFMLCHPHNPVGTAFNREELMLFSEWASSRELLICSDEIHCDLLLDPGHKHLPIARLNEETAGRTITLMAPSKTYNLPGFGCSFAVISNPDLRIRFKKAMAGIVPDPAVMGFRLAEVAFRDAEDWRQALLEYLRANRELTMSRLRKISGLIPYSPVATYLLWIDARELPVKHPHAFFEEHGVGLSDGADFGAPGYLRLNLGCSRSLLEEALDRMERACSGLAKG